MHADMRRVRTRAELEALSRKEIQQLAMDASLKANQKTSALIEQILAGQGGQVACPAQCKSAAPRTPLGDVSNGGSSDANIAAPDGHGAAEEDELAQQFAACSFSEKRRRRQSSSRLSLSRSLREAELSPGPAASTPALDGSASRETVSPVSALGWEEEGELETIRETLAQLLELGFSDEEAQWAIDQAKKKRDSELSDNEAERASLSDANSGAEDGGAEADALSTQMNLLAVNDEGPTAPGGNAF